MKKLLIFVVVLALLGAGGYMLLKKNKGVVVTEVAKKAIDYLPTPEGREEEMATVTEIAKHFLTSDGTTHRIFVFLQNNMELRPTGGFLGQFAILEIRDGQIISSEFMDSNVLDQEIKTGERAPLELQKWLGIKSWKFRDSNWSPDFPTSVAKALEFYGKKEGANTDFDAVFALNATLLNDLLAITGPITIVNKKHPDGITFTQEDGLQELQRDVEEIYLRDEMIRAAEKEAEELGIEYKRPKDENGKKIKLVTHAERNSRKDIIGALATAIEDKLFDVSEMKTTIPALVNFGLEGLTNKDVQMWFKDDELQAKIHKFYWTGEVDTEWDGDYLMIVDANVGALKSDYHIERAIEHTVDFRGLGAEKNDATAGRMVRYLTPSLQERIMAGTYRAPGPLATTRVTYTHTATESDWRTSDYHSYTRMIVPADTTWIVREWFFAPTVDTEEFANRTTYEYKFDVLISDPVLPTMLQYVLPDTITEEGYKFKIQKQSGIGTVPFVLTVIGSDGTTYQYETDLSHDTIVTMDDMMIVE